MSASSSSANYRLQAKNLCLTYPQCDAEPSTVLQKIVEYFADKMRFAVVCRESHRTGEPHLHAAVALKERMRTRDAHLFDRFTGKHGNYQAARAMRKWVAYVAKEGDVVSHGVDLQAYLRAAAQGQSTRAMVVAEAIKSGMTLAELDEDHGDFLLLHMKKVQEYQAFQQRKKQRVARLGLGVFTFVSSTLDDYNLDIAIWLDANLLATREFKQEQLYVYGPPDVGKTHLVLHLESHGIRVYRMPYDGKWYDTYDDDSYDLIVLDEFKGQKTIQEMNLWLEGGPMMVNRRGTAPVLKRANLPFIILSNYAPREAYRNCSEQRLAPLLARLKVIRVPDAADSRIDICIEDTETMYDSAPSSPSLLGSSSGPIGPLGLPEHTAL